MLYPTEAVSATEMMNRYLSAYQVVTDPGDRAILLDKAVHWSIEADLARMEEAIFSQLHHEVAL